MSSLYYTEFYAPNLQSPSEESGYWCENELEYYQGTEEQPVIRVVRRRNTANKKERRRTQSINNAFADLREAIPNVPKDTKLSKIKTLRLATSYIGYLMGVLENEDCGDGFKADLGAQPRRQSTYYSQVEGDESRKMKGRTGWPQHVWALELKQETLSGGDPSH